MAEDAKEILINYIKENENKFYRIAYSYTGQRDAALDVVQEAIIKALENIEKLRQREFIRTWFYRILINEALTYLKKNKKYVSLEYENIDDENFENFENLSTDSIDIYKSIQKLNDKIRMIIILRYFENLKIEEIAQITKLNVNTVKSRLYKGLKEIKISIEGRK